MAIKETLRLAFFPLSRPARRFIIARAGGRATFPDHENSISHLVAYRGCDLELAFVRDGFPLLPISEFPLQLSEGRNVLRASSPHRLPHDASWVGYETRHT